ncbi:MAG: hypothetical protein ACRDZZ_03510, partial [Ilumatobacteraceae bacterium]
MPSSSPGSATPVIVSSAAAADAAPASLNGAHPAGYGRLAFGAVVVALGAVMLATHRAGHYWGDDFALYLRQADALLGGPDIGRVADANRFMLDNSQNPDFSPPVYPWGWPLLLAAPVAIGGLDVDALSMVTTVAMLAFLVGWYRFTRDRLPRPLALTGMVLLGLSPLYVGWTELLGSEQAFMAAVFGSFVWLDRCKHRWMSTWNAPVVAGVLAAACFTVRREGLAFLAAIAAAQLVDVIDMRRRPRLLAHAAAPYAAFAIAVAAVQLILPSTLVPRYEGTGVGNIVRFHDTYLHAVAESFGSDSHGLGWIVVVLAVAGLAHRMVTAWRVDLPMVAYGVVVALIGCSFHIPSSRYVATVIPIVLYGLLQLPSAVVGVVGSRARVPVAMATALCLT